MRTNESLSLLNKNEYIEYNDGIKKELFTDNITALWELLEVMAKPNNDQSINNWQLKYRYDNSEVKEILKYLEESRIIVPDTDVVDNNHPEKRYYNFFETFENGKKDYNAIKNTNILIIGAGTVGSTLCASLSKFSISNIYLIDDDKVTTHNINSQFVFNKNDIGSYKVDVISKEINDSCTNTKVTGFVSKVNHNNIEMIEKIISQREISCVFSCFDGGNKNTHKGIYQSCVAYNIPYIINGYTSNTAISLFLNGPDGFSFIDNDFKEGFAFLNNNKGLITHSIASSMLCIEHLLSYVSTGTSTRRKEYKFEYPYLLRENENLPKVNFLKEEDIIKELKNIEKKIPVDDKDEKLENQVVSLYRAVEVMDEFAEEYTSLDLIKSKLNSIVDELSEEGEESLEVFQNEYHEIKNSINHLNEVLAAINFMTDYEERVKQQKMAFQTILDKSSELINAIINIKKEYLHKDYLNTEYKIEHGFSKENMKTFVNSAFQIYEQLALKVYSKLNPGVKEYDYLFHTDKVQVGKERTLDLLINVMNKLGNSSILGINFKRHLEKVKENHLIVESNEYIATSYYFPEHNETVIRIREISSIPDCLLLVHELGHSYFNQYYKSDFYDKSNILLNEMLAHFTEILFGTEILKSNMIDEDEAFRFQYLYRLNQFVISSIASHYSEAKLINDIEKGNKITAKEFLKMHTTSELLPNISFKNSDHSKLNILLYEPFATGLFDIIEECISFSLAIFMYEKFKDDLDLLDYRLKDLLSEKEIGLNEICYTLFEETYDESFVLKVLNNVVHYLENI